MIADTRIYLTVGLPVLAVLGVALSLGSYTPLSTAAKPQTITVHQAALGPMPISRAQYQLLLDEEKVSQTAFAPLLAQTFTSSNDDDISELSDSGSTTDQSLLGAPLENQPSLSAQAALVLDERSGSVLFEHNSAARLAPASTTKLLTALVALDTFQLSDTLTVSNLQGLDGARIGFFVGEALTLDQLLYALLIQSGNDAALVISRSHPEGEQGFVADMNEKAVALGLTSTHVTNAMGFDHPDHYSTARDLGILAREVMKVPLLRSIVAQPETIITDVTGQFSHRISSTNVLLSDAAIIGIKTGTTDEAGQVLITQREENGRSLLMVIMGSEDRYADTTRLQQWIDQEIIWITPDELLALTR